MRIITSLLILFFPSAVVYLKVGTSLRYHNGRGLLTAKVQTNPLVKS